MRSVWKENTAEGVGVSLSRVLSAKPMPEIIGQEVIKQCLNKDRNAQRQVYERLFPNAMKVCKRYCQSHDQAMEVLNTGFLKVFTQMDQFSGKGSFEGWVHRIMVNTALDHVRQESRNHTKIVYSDQFEDHPDEETEDESFNDIEIETVYQCINELPPVSRMVFNLFVFEDYQHAAIGEQLGISVGTSKWHLSHARHLLRERIRAVYQHIKY